MLQCIHVVFHSLLALCIISSAARAAEDLPADEASVVAALKKLGAKIETGDDRRIISVDLTRTKATAVTIEMLKPCTQLQRLTATGIPVTDESLKVVAKRSKLESLELDATDITDAGLRHLSSLKQLKRLSLAGTAITDEGLKAVESMIQLTSLNVGRRPVESFSLQMTPQGPRPVPNIPASQKATTNITDAGMASLARLVNLKVLDLRGAKISDKGLEQLRPLTMLEMLTLDKTQITDAGLTHLGVFTKLQFLDVSETGITDNGCVHLAELTGLTSLNLQKTKVTDQGVVQLAPLKSLKSLWLKETRVTAVAVKKLQKEIRTLRDTGLEQGTGPFGEADTPRFAELEEVGAKIQPIPNVQIGPAWMIDFQGTNIGDDDLFRVKAVDDNGFGYISMIVFAGTRITDAVWSKLQYEKLEWIDVANTKVTGQRIEVLEKLPYLKTIILLGTPVTNEAVKKLGKFPALQSLNLADTGVSDDVVDALTSSKTLRILNLKGTRVTPAVVE